MLGLRAGVQEIPRQLQGILNQSENRLSWRWRPSSTEVHVNPNALRDLYASRPVELHLNSETPITSMKIGGNSFAC